jgi:hypothetical protein
MSVSHKSSQEDKAALLAECVNWRACVEQVVLLLAHRNDPDTGAISVWLIKWLNDPKNVRRSVNMPLDLIIENGKREIGR